MASELLGDIRSVVRSRLHDGLDLGPALTRWPRRCRGPLQLAIGDDAQYSVAEAEALLRLVQEALTNSVRTPCRKPGSTCGATAEGSPPVVVQDDGHGAALREGNGLAGMRERLAAVGGTLAVSTDTRRRRGARIAAARP